MENTNSAPRVRAAAAGQIVASPITIVRIRPQLRRSAAPTSAPNAAHAAIDVNAALPMTRNPTADAAIAPVTTAAQPVPRRDDRERNDGCGEQNAAEREHLTDDRQRQ